MKEKRSGVSRYDGQTWTTFTTKDGLVDNNVMSIIQAQDGALWFGTWYFDGGGGVSRYDGETWTNFTAKDELPSDSVFSIFQTRDGVLWFATWGGVTKCYTWHCRKMLHPFRSDRLG